MSAVKVIESPEQKLFEYFQNYKQFCRSLLDAYVLIDQNGTIQASNPLFGLLVGKPSRQLLGKMKLGEIIDFSNANNDLLLASLQNLKRPSRFDEVQVRITTQKEEKKLIMGVFPFLEKDSQGKQTYLGSLLHIRDITAEASLQGKYINKALESVTDSLTGLKSRAILSTPEAVFEKEQQHAVFLLDIDHFKSVNDQFGHPCGDYVIKELARVMQEHFGSRPTLVRYGGEEFLVIAPGISLQEAKSHGNKLIQRVASHPFEYEGVSHKVTISCGLISLAKNTPYSQLDDHISAADKALYAAKNAGRNRAHYVYDSKVSACGDYETLTETKPSVSGEFLTDASKYKKSIYWNQVRPDTFSIRSTLVEKWGESSDHSAYGENQFCVSRSGQQKKLVQFCLDSLGPNQRPGIQRALVNTAEELYTNILYDAPCAAFEQSGHKHCGPNKFLRGTNLELSSTEQGHIYIEETANFWQISAVDPWGSFTAASFWQHYSKSQQLDPKFRSANGLSKGAGLGLLRILYFSSAVTCRVWPNIRTELSVFISKKEAPRPLKNQDRSAAYFLYES